MKTYSRRKCNIIYNIAKYNVFCSGRYKYTPQAANPEQDNARTQSQLNTGAVPDRQLFSAVALVTLLGVFSLLGLSTRGHKLFLVEGLGLGVEGFGLRLWVPFV